MDPLLGKLLADSLLILKDGDLDAEEARYLKEGRNLLTQAFERASEEG